MIRKLFASIFLAFLLCGSAAAYSPYTSICSIGMANGGAGSGFLVKVEGPWAWVVSAEHVGQRVGNQVTIRWRWGGDQKSKGKVIYVMPGDGFRTDICIIKCPRPQWLVPVPLSKYDPDNGPWVAAGFRDGRMRIAQSDSSERWEDNDYTIRLDDGGIPGMSGGPCFDRYGRVIGVVVAGPRNEGDYSWEVMSDGGSDLRVILDKCE